MYKNKCEESGYYVDDLADLPRALVDRRINDVYAFDVGIEVLGLKEGN